MAVPNGQGSNNNSGLAALVRHERNMYTRLSEIEDDIYDAEARYLNVGPLAAPLGAD